MKVFALRPFTAVPPTWRLRDRIALKIRQTAERVAALNARVDEARAQRDRANEADGTVDRAFWIYLR